MLRLGSEGVGLDKQMLTNSLFCIMKSLKRYVNIEGELFTFYQWGKFPLTRSRFLPHAVIFFHGNFFFPNIVFPQSQEQKAGARAPGTPGSPSHHALTGNMGFLEGFGHPPPISTPTRSPPLLCAHHTGMRGAGRSQARSCLREFPIWHLHPED